MFDVVNEVLGYSGALDITELILQICGALIIILTVTFIDLIYRVFRHFWR